ncbi:MAG: two-component regulator propeller domain-containing protein [Aestuariibacter sp.]
MRVPVLHLILCLIWTGIARAEPVYFNSENTLRVEEGLPSDTVFSLVQDELGFIWLGTPAGIGVLNGHEPALYHGKNGDEVSYYSPGNLYHDSNNVIWVGTWGHGVYQIAPNRKAVEPYLPELRVLDTRLGQIKVQAIYVSDIGDVWIGSFDKGLIRITSKQQVQHFYLNAAPKKQLSDNRVWNITEDQDGNIWVATSNGLNRIDISTQDVSHFLTSERYSVANRLVREVLAIGDYIWAGTNMGVFRIHKDSFDIEPITLQERQSFAVTRIKSDGDTGLWIATFNGLLHYDLLNNAFSTFNDGGFVYKASQDIRDILVTKDNLLLLATRTSGVITLNQAPLTFSIVTSESAVKDKKNHIFSIATDLLGHTWAGTNNGLIKYDLNTGQRLSLPDILSGFNQGRITATTNARNGREIWFGTSDNLYSYDVSSGELQAHRTLFSVDSINHIQRLIEDSQGNIWVTVSHQGIFKIAPDMSVQHYHQHGSGYFRLPSNNVVQLVESQWGDILLLVDDMTLLKMGSTSPAFETVEIKIADNILLNNLIATTIGSAENGSIWLGSYKGLIYLPSEGQVAKWLTIKDGLSNNDVRAIVADQVGQVWVSTANGVTMFNEAGKAKRIFTVKDGLSGNALNLRSAFNCHPAKLCFGSEKGINTVKIERIVDEAEIAKVAVTKIWVNNDLQQEPALGVNTMTLDLDNTQRNLRFKFTAIDHDPSSTTVLYYKLHGFDENWQIANISRIANYTNLEAGEYIFRVTTRPQRALSGEASANILVRIVPPFWLRPMTQFVAVVSILLLLAFSYRLRISQIRKNENKLNKLVAIRTENMAILGSIGMEITRATSFEEIFERLKHHLKIVLYRHKFMLGMVDEEHNQLDFNLVIHEAVKLPGFAIALSEVSHPAAWSYLHQKEVMVQRGEKAGHFIHHLEEQGCASILCLPLKVDETKIGVIYVQSFYQESFGEYERQFLKTIAAYTAIAIKNAQFYQNEKELQLKRISWLENITHYLNHEMKNAILGAQTSLTMMTRKADDPSMMKYIERAGRSHEEMCNIMKAVSNTTSLEAAIMQAEMTEINQSQIVEQRLNEYRHIYRDVNIVAEVEADIGIIGNEDLLVQLLDKLVNNAIEHHTKGTAIIVKLVKVKNLSVLIVKNIGDELPEDTEFIFGLFTSTKANSHSGNFGMGLYIARLIAEFHKGKVVANAISDTEKHGAIFSFSMPMQPL